MLKILRLYLKGLNRNFKIINYGDVPPIYVTSKNTQRFMFAKNTVISHFVCAFRLFKLMLLDNPLLFEVQSKPILFVGASSNNEREFVFFNSLLADAGSNISYSRSINLSYLNRRAYKLRISDYFLVFLFYCVTIIYLFRIRLNPTSYKYLSYYARLFVSFYFSLRSSGARPVIGVVANDHTDISVVAAIVLNYFGVPVIYIQHAEISNRFPPLDFDLSILRNKKSLQKYREIGSINGEVFVLPRADRRSCFDRIFERDEKVVVVIYLSSIYFLDKVIECVRDLQKNGNVLAVGVKPHPRVNLATLDVLSGIFLCEKIPAFNHIAIVPNSSVSIELLEQGVPVYQYFGLDDIGYDYYGLVGDRVTCEIMRESLYEQFWLSGFYNRDWLVRFSEYSPSADESWRESKDLLLQKIRKFPIFD